MHRESAKERLSKKSSLMVAGHFCSPCFKRYSKKRQIVDLGCVKKVMPGLPAEGRVLSAQRAIEPAVVHVQLQAACCKVRVGTARLVSLKS